MTFSSRCRLALKSATLAFYRVFAKDDPMSDQRRQGDRCCDRRHALVL